jgi:hypothetical protein
MKAKIQVIAALCAVVLSGAAVLALAEGPDAGRNAGVSIQSVQNPSPAGVGQTTPSSNGGSNRSTAGIQAVTEYDFTTGADKYYGTGGAKDLGGGVYGMIAGETNGTGTITVADKALIVADLNKSGYYTADLNFSGTVTVADKSFIVQNLNQSTQVP